MKCVGYVFAVVLWWLAYSPSVFAAEVSFSVLPSSTPSDGVTVIQAYIDGKGVALNALEGTLGFLGKGAEFITKVVVETGDSVFTLWPAPPLFDDDTHALRFTAGSPEPFIKKESIFRMRVYSESEEPITVSWLSGEAFQADGIGTSEGISSRSLVVNLEKGAPNVMRSTSDDRRPPQIISAEISYDVDTLDDSPFISVYASDDLSGISHYEFIEHGVKTNTAVGTYIIQDRDMREPILVVVYDKAGNSSSVKVGGDLWSGVTNMYTIAILFALACIVILLYRLVRYRSRK